MKIFVLVGKNLDRPHSFLVKPDLLFFFTFMAENNVKFVKWDDWYSLIYIRIPGMCM